MDNKQSPVLHYIKTLLKDDFRVGEYPFDVDRYAMGDRDSVTLVQDGNENISEGQQNKLVYKDYLITLWLYSNNKKQTIDHVLDLQTSIEDKIMDDLSLGGTAECVELISIEKGEALSEFNGHTVGYFGNKTCRRLNYSVKIKQVR